MQMRIEFRKQQPNRRGCQWSRSSRHRLVRQDGDPAR